MSLITRLQGLLLRLGISSGTRQMILIAALLSLLAFGAFRLDGLNVSAKSAQLTGSLVGPTSSGVPWQTVHEFEPEDLKPLTRSFAEDGAPLPPKVATKPRTSSDSGESLFLQSSRLFQQGHYAQALKVAEDMAYRYPNFQLGHLLLADLRATMAPKPIAIDMLWQKPEAQRRLGELKTEAQQRTSHAGKEALAGQQPDAVRYLSSKINHVVLVDAQKSRLYVLVRQADAPADATPRVIFDAYVSVGNSGTGKWREGDSKTPVGVYFVQKHLTDPMLPDLYGSGALTLDYPNLIDRSKNRTGSGIWLHGSPSSQYARAPTATDGCVVLANDDMTRLVQLGIPPETPVIIADQLNWHAVAAPASADRTMSLVTPAERSSQPPWPKPADLREASEAWHMVSAFQWKDQQQTVAVVSYDPPASSASKHRLHTYWIMQGDQWQQVNRPSAQ